MEDRCVCCGEIIPEGRQVCPNCEHKGMETENKGLIDVRDCPCDGCKAKPCGHPARCVKFTLWLNKTVDAVEVVRCKDCQSFEKKWSWDNLNTGKEECCGYCWHWDYEPGMSPNQVDGDDFCSYGERGNDG